VSVRRYVVAGLSVSRAVTSLLFLHFVLQDGVAFQYASLAMLLVIELSDFFDGKLARRWKVTSESGYMLDAFGDRAAYVAYAVAATARAGMSPLLAYGVIVRDFALFASRAYFTKWSTLVQRDRVWTKLNGILARVLLWCFLATWYDSVIGWSIVRSHRTASVASLNVIMCLYLLFSYYALALLLRRYSSRGR
jgi:phosphatidylglycerophosphate synthase